MGMTNLELFDRVLKIVDSYICTNREVLTPGRLEEAKSVQRELNGRRKNEQHGKDREEVMMWNQCIGLFSVELDDYIDLLEELETAEEAELKVPIIISYLEYFQKEIKEFFKDRPVEWAQINTILQIIRMATNEYTTDDPGFEDNRESLRSARDMFCYYVKKI